MINEDHIQLIPPNSFKILEYYLLLDNSSNKPLSMYEYNHIIQTMLIKMSVKSNLTIDDGNDFTSFILDFLFETSIK